MNKETFLQELRSHLQILEEREQQDILDEYAQHIDMKMQKGLSEEEAIRDFGSVRELAAEILEAYHVNPEFEQKKSPGKKSDLTKAATEGKQAWRSAWAWVSERAAVLGRGVRKGVSGIGRKIKGFGRWLTGLFRKKSGKMELQDMTEQAAELQAAEDTQMQEGGAEIIVQKKEPLQEGNKKGKRAGSVPGGVGRGFQALGRGLFALIRWCLRLIWNALWLCASFLSGCLALLMLFGFGTLVILLLQGYPLAGILLICLGGMLCCGTIAVLCFSFLRRRTREEAEDEAAGKETTEEKAKAEPTEEEDADEAGEEVQHEQIA